MKALLLITLISSTNFVFGVPPVNSDPDPNVYDECGEGCGEGSCCIEWNFFQINDPDLPYFKNLGITSDFIRKTCSNAKSSALMSEYAKEGNDYVEVNMVESTNFYMNWKDFAPTYRTEYCEFSGIDPATCTNYTEADMVEHVWGGRENAESTIYRVGPLCSSKDDDSSEEDDDDDEEENENSDDDNDDDDDDEGPIAPIILEPIDCCFRYGLGARAKPCCLETITCEEHDKLVEDSKTNPIVGGSFGKHTVCPKDADEAHRLVSEKSSSECCFRYGLGARAVPCCLSTITCEEHDQLVEQNKTNPIAGGAFGKHSVCPKDAAEAHLLVSG